MTTIDVNVMVIHTECTFAEIPSVTYQAIKGPHTARRWRCIYCDRIVTEEPPAERMAGYERQHEQIAGRVSR